MKTSNTSYLYIVLGFILVYIAAIVNSCYIEKVTPSTPIEDKRIDTLIIERVVIQNQVEHLDSIKNEAIREAATLDDDSTVKLFYNLLKY